MVKLGHGLATRSAKDRTRSVCEAMPGLGRDATRRCRRCRRCRREECGTPQCRLCGCGHRPCDGRRRLSLQSSRALPLQLLRRDASFPDVFSIVALPSLVAAIPTLVIHLRTGPASAPPVSPGSTGADIATSASVGGIRTTVAHYARDRLTGSPRSCSDLRDARTRAARRRQQLRATPRGSS